MTDNNAETEVSIAGNRGAWAVIDTRQRFAKNPEIVYSKLATREAAEFARSDVAKNTVAEGDDIHLMSSKPIEFYNLTATFLEVLRKCNDTSDIDQLARDLASASLHGRPGGMGDDIPF